MACVRKPVRTACSWRGERLRSSWLTSLQRSWGGPSRLPGSAFPCLPLSHCRWCICCTPSLCEGACCSKASVQGSKIYSWVLPGMHAPYTLQQELGPSQQPCEGLCHARSLRKVGWIFAQSTKERDFIMSTEEVCQMAGELVLPGPCPLTIAVGVTTLKAAHGCLPPTLACALSRCNGAMSCCCCSSDSCQTRHRRLWAHVG